MTNEMLEKIRASIRHAMEGGAFYAQRFAGINADDIRTEEDFRKLPFTDKGDLRGAYPALVNEIEEAAAKNAREQERQRIQDIEEMSLPGSEAMTTEAKFTKPMSAADYAKAVVKNAKQQGAAYLADAAKDAAGSGMSGVEGEPGGGEKPDEFLDALKAMGKKQQ